MDYMIHDALWASCGLPKGQVRHFLCLDCMAVKLGRPLQITDFKPVYCNIPIFNSYLMGRKDNPGREQEAYTIEMIPRASSEE